MPLKLLPWLVVDWLLIEESPHLLILLATQTPDPLVASLRRVHKAMAEYTHAGALLAHVFHATANVAARADETVLALACRALADRLGALSLA